MSAIRGFLLAVTLLVVSSGAPAAGAFQTPQELKQAVKGFLHSQTADYPSTPQIEVGPIDPRLRLPRCEKPLQTAFAPGRQAIGITTVGVSCPGAKPWTIYVQARVRVFDKVVIAARPLGRGNTLAEGDVKLVSRDLSTLRGGYLSDLNKVLGQVVTRSVPAGTVIDTHLLKPPKVVHRGDQVSIFARGHGLEVRMEGEALQDGAKGELIHVRNLSSKRSVEARVVGPGEVEVHF